jgi:hypothetical protein
MQYETLTVRFGNGDDYVVMTVDEFVNKYHKGLSRTTIIKAAERGKLDYIKPARDIFILITQYSLSYTPRHSHKK